MKGLARVRIRVRIRVRDTVIALARISMHYLNSWYP